MESREWEGYENVYPFAPQPYALMGMGFNVMMQNRTPDQQIILQVDLWSYGAPYAAFQVVFATEEDLDYFYRAAPKLNQSIIMAYLSRVMA